jgi:hypothetical protein
MIGFGLLDEERACGKCPQATLLPGISEHQRQICYGASMTDEGVGQDVEWMQANPGYVPPEIDTSTPSVARVYVGGLGRKP